MSKRRIVFLDVDGVCNSLGSCLAFGNTYDRFDPVSGGLLERAAVTLDFYVVLSSAWRTGHDVAGCKRIFSDRRLRVIAERLIDKTGEGPGVRGNQIALWLTRNAAHVSEYVIIDDDSDMLMHQLPRFIRTEHALGFRLPEYVKLLELFEPASTEAANLRRSLDSGAHSLHGTFQEE